MGASPAFAASPGETACTDAGGTFERVNGQVSCIYPVVSDPVGNSENSGGKSQTVDTQDTETSNGTLNNKAQARGDRHLRGTGQLQLRLLDRQRPSSLPSEGGLALASVRVIGNSGPPPTITMVGGVQVVAERQRACPTTPASPPLVAAAGAS